MSDAQQPTPDVPPPQTLSEFKQQVAAQVIARMRAQTDATISLMEQQQARLEAQTLELVQALRLPTMLGTLPGMPGTNQPGESGQPQAVEQKPAAPAGPT